MLLINIHELQIIFAQSITLAAFKYEVQHIWRVLRLQGQNIFVLGCAQNLCERGEIDTERDVAIAAVGRETFGLQHHGDESDVRVVHGLEGDAGVIAVEIAVLDEVFDRVDHLKL